MLRSGWSEDCTEVVASVGEDSVSAFSVSLSGADSLSFLSLLDKSNPEPAPGVLGVLTDPNEANAPEPRPKAEEALEGVFAEGVVKTLKGFVFEYEEPSPNLRPLNVRVDSLFDPSLLSESRVDRDSLLLLLDLRSVGFRTRLETAHFARLVQRLAFSMRFG